MSRVSAASCDTKQKKACSREERAGEKRCDDCKGANKPDSVHRPKAAPIIHLSNLPETLSGFQAGATRAASRVPYLILLQRGFAVRRRSRASPVVSYTTFSPLPGANAGRSVFCGTFRRRRSGGASPALTAGPLALRSPDFPPLPKQERPVAPLAATAKRNCAKLNHHEKRHPVKRVPFIEPYTGCARTSDRPQSPGCAAPSVRQTAAVPDDSRYRRNRSEGSPPRANAWCAAAHNRA